MPSRRTISNTFTVTTMDDPVSVQAQYSPDKTVVHTVWQAGDLYMRTRESDSSAWSAWHKIVGENGGETDYSFGISQYKTTENAQTAPSDITSWSDAPLAVTTAKPYLWSKVQQKSWNESTQAYVVDSTRYIRLTGEGGEEYIIISSQGSVTIGENETTGTLSNATFSFYKKEGGKDKETYTCYCSVFQKKGSTYTLIKKYTTAGAAVTYTHTSSTSVPALTASNYDAIVVCIYNAASDSHSGYLTELEIPVRKNGDSPYFADLDNEMDSIACANDGKPSSEQTVETNVKLYRGSTALSPTLAVNDDSPSGAAYTNGTAKDSITVTWNNTTGNIKFKFGTSNSRTKTETFCITLTVTDNGATITRYLYFTVNCIRAASDGNPAALYRLVPSVNEIVKKKDGSYVPTGTSYITCGVTKNVGGTQSTPAASEYTLKYSLNGDSETTYTATSVKVNQVTANLVFILYVNGIVVDRETIGIINDGVDGTSPYFADIDNEMASVACDKNGNITAAFSKTVGLHLWRGSTEIAIDSLSATLNGTTITSSGTVGNITITLDKTAKTLAVSVANGKQIAATNDIAITLSGGSSGTHQLHFVLNGVRAGADGSPAVIYDLIPSASSVKCDSSNTLTPAKLTCNVQRTEGTTISPATSAHGTLYYKKNGDINSSSDGTPLTIDIGEVTLAASDEFVVFAFFVGTTMVDKERVPIVKDGQNMRENLIDNSEPAYEVTALGSGQKHRITDKTYEPNKLPEAGTKVSAQARVKCIGCTFLSDPRIIVYIENEYPNAWMQLFDIKTEEDWAFLSSEGNGTIDAKREDITLPSNNGQQWDGKVRLRIDNLVSGTVSVERVKLEVGENCSDWCLSENDKVGSNAPYVELSRSTIIYKANNDGQSISSQDFPITYALKVNGNTCTISSVNNITITLPNNVTVKSGTKTTSGCTINCAHSVVMSGVISITITGTYDGVSYTATGTITVSDSREGQQGEQGEHALTLVLDTYAIAFPTDSDYNVGSGLTYTVGAKMFLGNNAQQTITSLTATSSDGDVYTTGTSPANGVKITIGENSFVSTVKITVTATCEKGSRTATINLTPTPQGEQGTRGKVGRFFYYAGEFDSTNNTKTFIVNDAEAPYFSHGVNASTRLPNCHVYNPSGNGTLTMAQMWANSSQSWNNAPWEIFTNDFQYLMTRAVFSSQAYLGSFVINEDWLISQHGTRNGSASTQYTYFDPLLGADTERVLHSNVNVTYYNTALSSFALKSGLTYTFTITVNTSSTKSEFELYNAIGTLQKTVTFDNNATALTQSFTFSPSSSGEYYFMTEKWSNNITVLATIKVACSNAFIPNFAVDGKTGKTYQNDAYISGTLKATKYYVSKQKVSLTMSGTTPATGNINPGVQLVEVTSNGTSGYSNYLQLPKASENEGMEIEIFCLSNNVWGYSNIPVELTSLGGTIKNSQDYWNFYQYRCILQPGQKAKVYSDGTVWTVYEHNTQSLSQLYTEKAYASDSIETPSLIGGKNSGDAYDSGYSADNFPVALPSCIKTSSFTLPASPQNGMMIFCKGISAQLTVTTKGHAIMNRNGTSNWCNANSSATIADRDSVILVFSSAAGKWLYFSCE